MVSLPEARIGNSLQIDRRKGALIESGSSERDGGR